MSDVTLWADGRVRLHAFVSMEDWVQGAVEGIAAGLQSPSPIDGRGGGGEETALASHWLAPFPNARRAAPGRTRVRGGLLLSGGNTPAPVYSALSTLPLDWKNITIGLVDDRFLPEGDPNRNDGLIRRTLIANAAAEATFTALIAPGDTLESAVHSANQNATPATVVVLGMGDDGHSASLFPGMQGLAAALAAQTPYVAVDATGCPGAQTWPQRISLTPAGLAPASTRILLIRGEGKRRLLERVVSGTDDIQEYPVRMAWMLPGPALDVYWCP